MSSITLLEQLEKSGCKVDADTYNPSIIKSLPFKPHDATSNQALIRLQIFDPENDSLIRSVIKQMPDASPHELLTVLTCKFAALFISDITGRVLAQTSPSFPNNKEKIIEHARLYDQYFKAEGINRDRYCIKIFTTSAGVQAANILQAEGIQTLGTVIFSVEQAIAASQAGMYAISPYFNRREVMAQALLGCDHVTVLSESLRDLTSLNGLPTYAKNERNDRIYLLANRQDIPLLPWKQPTQNKIANHLTSLLNQADPLLEGSPAVGVDLTKDYLAGQVLDEHNKADKAAAFRLGDALGCFKGFEDEIFGYLAGIKAEILT